MYTIARLRLWLSRRLLGVSASNFRPAPVGSRFRPVALPLEDRRMPGDILWALLGVAPDLTPLPDESGTPHRRIYNATENRPAAAGEQQLSDEPTPGLRRRTESGLPRLTIVAPKSHLAADEAATVSFPGFGGPGTDRAPVGSARATEAAQALASSHAAVDRPVPVQPAATPTVGLDSPRIGQVAQSAPVGSETALHSPKTTSQSSPIRGQGDVLRTQQVPSRITTGPSIDGEAGQPRGEFNYQVPGATVGLSAKPDRIAVQLTDTTGAGLAELTGRGALSGATFVRWVHGTELAVLQAAGLGARAGSIVDPAIAFSVPVYAEATTGAEEVILNQVIVKLADWRNADTFFATNGFDSYRGLDGTYDVFVATVNGYGKSVLDTVARLQGAAGVVYAEPNGYSDLKVNYEPNDPQYTSGNMWHIKNTGQSGGQAGVDVNLTKAWDVNPGGSTSMVLAAVDEGIDFAHEDLTPWVNPGETPGDNIDNDGNGWIDDLNGWNFVSNNNTVTPSVFDMDANHGTAVAGLLAAKGDNAIGVVSGSYKAKVMSSRIFEGAGVATDADIASAIYYASGRTKSGTGTWVAARAVNNSWGAGSPPRPSTTPSPGPRPPPILASACRSSSRPATRTHPVSGTRSRRR